MEKYYKILEIHTNASEQDIKQAYRELVKVWHPDRFAHDIKLQKRAEDKLKEINDAYQRIVDHLKQRRETQEKRAGQPPPKQPHNSWICPACLNANYIYDLSCHCGFRTNNIEIMTYRADQSSADLYDAILFNRSMNYTDRAEYLSQYLQKRFPNSKEANLLRESSAKSPQHSENQNKESFLKRFYRKYFLWDIYAREQRRNYFQQRITRTFTTKKSPGRSHNTAIKDNKSIIKTDDNKKPRR